MPEHLTDPDCIFCKIIAGQIPCHKIHEDDHTLAFLDIGPLSHGHCLLIPKDHHETLTTMPPEEAGICMANVTHIARAVQRVTGVEGYNVLQNNGKVSGQEVPHVHFHIIPRAEGDGLGYRWNPGPLDNDVARQLLADITAKLD
ncbi:MAG: HIT family protein [Planctomycetota bacterium]|jgi:histidine triad (HIT) family protein